VVVTDLPGADAAGGSGAVGAATTPSSGSGRTTSVSSTRPEKAESGTADGPSPDPNWFDASGLGGFLGVGADSAPADAAAAAAGADALPADLESALANRDGASSPSSPVLLGASLLILLVLAVGVAVRWWDRRPGRYWPA
jgi:hypothetical protein